MTPEDKFLARLEEVTNDDRVLHGACAPYVRALLQDQRPWSHIGAGSLPPQKTVVRTKSGKVQSAMQHRNLRVGAERILRAYGGRLFRALRDGRIGALQVGFPCDALNITLGREGIYRRALGKDYYVLNKPKQSEHDPPSAKEDKEN